MSETNGKTELLPRLWQEDAYTANTYEYLGDVRSGKSVWLAENRLEGGACVLRCLEVFDEEIYMMLKEARVEGTPEILEVYKAAYDNTDHLVVVEEYVRGVTLSRFLDIKGADELNIKSIAFQLACILDRLHRQNPPVIHRDVKPDNILVMGDGTVILTDFNIARHVSGVKSRDTLIMGTAGYAAPEQFGFAESDARTDVYGLGATVRELLKNSKVSSPALSKLVDKCTALDPEDRPQSMQEVMEQIAGHDDDAAYARLSTEYGSDSASGRTVKDPYAFPGFRQGVWWHKVIAVCGYLSMAYLSLNLKVQSVTNERGLNLCRLAMFLGFIAITFFSLDYRGMRSKVKWMQGFTRIGKICAIMLVDIAIFIAAVLLGTTILYLFGWEK